MSFDDRITRFTISNQEEDISVEFTLTQEGVQRMLGGEFRNVIVCNEDSKAIIFVESNTDWTASSDEPWMEVIKSEGSFNDYLEIDLSVNLVGQTRSGSISLETIDGQFANTIRVFQPSRNDVNACIDPVLLEVGPDAGTTQFEITTDQNWTIESDETWISSISSLEGNASETISLDYDVLNDTTEVRLARIKVLVENIGIINLLVFQGNNFTSSSNDLELIPDEHLELFPNPFQDRISGRIFMEKSTDLVIKMMNFQGRSVAPIVRKMVLPGWNDFDFDTSSLPPGMYVIHFVSETSSGAKRIIKF